MVQSDLSTSNLLSDSPRTLYNAPNRLGDLRRHLLLKKMTRGRRRHRRVGQQPLDSPQRSAENRVALAPDDRRRPAKTLYELLATTHPLHRLVLQRITDHSGERKRRRVVPKSSKRISVLLGHLAADTRSVPLRPRQPGLWKPQQSKGDLAYEANPTEPVEPRPAESRLRRPQHGVHDHQASQALRTRGDGATSDRPSPVLSYENDPF